MYTDKYDLIIVGGGVMGTFHAYHALQMGKKVLQLEKDNFPTGSTVRNFGMVVPSGLAGKWFDFGVRSLEIYQSIQEKADISVRRNGSVYIASDPDEQTLIHELKDHYDQAGYPQQLLSKKDLLERYSSIREPYAREALLFEDEISIEPHRMIRNVQEYLKQQFAAYTLQYNATVIDCQSSGSGVLVKLANGATATALKAVICNGYEFKLLYPDLFATSGQVITKLQMMQTVPLHPAGLQGNILTGLTIRRYESFEAYCPSFKTIPVPEHYGELKNYGIHLLFKTAMDGSIIIGDSHEYAAPDQIDTLGFNINNAINALMLQEAERIVNFPVQQKIASTWTGLYAQHNEKQIVEYDLEDRIHIRTCIGGKGMTASAGYAEDSIRNIFGA